MMILKLYAYIRSDGRAQQLQLIFMLKKVMFLYRNLISVLRRFLSTSLSIFEDINNILVKIWI